MIFNTISQNWLLLNYSALLLSRMSLFFFFFLCVWNIGICHYILFFQNAHAFDSSVNANSVAMIIFNHLYDKNIGTSIKFDTYLQLYSNFISRPDTYCDICISACVEIKLSYLFKISNRKSQVLGYLLLSYSRRMVGNLSLHEAFNIELLFGAQL